MTYDLYTSRYLPGIRTLKRYLVQIFTGQVVMAYVVPAYIVTAYIVTAYIVTAYIVMAHLLPRVLARQHLELRVQRGGDRAELRHRLAEEPVMASIAMASKLWPI